MLFTWPLLLNLCVCVCVLTYLWRQTVWPNYEVVGLQASVSDCSNPRLSRFFTITILSSLYVPQFLLAFSGSLIPFLPPPKPIPHRPPYFTHRHCFSLSFHPLLPAHIVRVWSNRPHVKSLNKCMWFWLTIIACPNLRTPPLNLKKTWYKVT